MIQNLLVLSKMHLAEPIAESEIGGRSEMKMQTFEESEDEMTIFAASFISSTEICIYFFLCGHSSRFGHFEFNIKLIRLRDFVCFPWLLYSV